MPSIRSPLLAAAWFESLLSTRSLGIALWIGLGFLTVSLFILGRTRWGQAKPLSKCVVLSIFAHILLAAYAYGTKLILDAPMPRGEDAIQITMLSAGEPLADERDRESVDEPWNQFVTTANLQPDVTGPKPRPMEDVSVERSPVEAIQVASAASAAVDAEWNMPAVKRPAVAEPGLEALQVTRPAEVPTPIETAPAQQRERIAAVGPSGTALPRADRIERPASPIERETSTLPDAQPTDDARLQQLADVVQSSETSDLTAGPDQLAETSNRNDSQSQSRDGNSAPEQPMPDPSAAGSSSPAQASISDSTPGNSAPPLRLGDGRPLPEVYQARIANNRLEAARLYGGNERTEAAVEAALAWLASVQSDDGRWDADRFEAGRETSVLGHNREGAGARADTGITGLAVLSFLGAGHSHLEGKYRVNVQRGLEFLLRSQMADGNMAGDSELFARMYCHGMASLAINEAFAMTGDHRLQPFVEQAVAYSLAAQHKTSGGWRYQPGDQGDMSQFGWQVLALKSAEFAGREIPEFTRGGMIRFLRNVSAGRNQGLASYRPNERASVTMTAESLLCRLLLKTDLERAQVNEAVDYLMQDLPGDGKANLYYWYYGTLALFQIQGESWSRWNSHLQDQLLQRQIKDGRDTGSWSPDTMWGGYGGRVYSTALATLCLEVYYRYLPIHGVDFEPQLTRRPTFDSRLSR